MRILICTNAYPPHFVGGAELVAHQVALEMSALSHEVAIFCGRPVDADVPHQYTRDIYEGLPVHRVTRQPRDYDLGRVNYIDLAVDARFQDVLVEFRPEVVHCHNLMGLSARIPVLASEAGARVALTLHDFWGFCLRNTLTLEDGSDCIDPDACRNCLPRRDEPRPPLRIRQDLLALAFDHIDRFVYPSAFLRDRYRQADFPEERAAHIPNGIDSVRYATIAPFAARQYSPQDPFRVMFAGYIGQHKGVLTLPPALGAMRNRQSIRVDIYGEGALEFALRQQIARNGMGHAFHFRGKLQPQAMVCAHEMADALVVPSVWSENQPVCIMEAMAGGRPVVASDIGGIPEMIRNGIDGLLCTPGDPRSFASAFDRLIENGTQAEEMGRRARSRIVQQTYRRQAQALLALFEEMLADPRPAGKPRRPVVSAPLDRIGQGESVPFLPTQAGHAQYVVPEEWLTSRLNSLAESARGENGASILSRIWPRHSR